MPTFKYVAKERSGKPINGVTEAQDKKAVIDALRKQDLVIVSISEPSKQYFISHPAAETVLSHGH